MAVMYAARAGDVGERDAVVIPHDHFLQTPWRLLNDHLVPALGREVPAMSLQHLQIINTPLTETIAYSLGQVGPLWSIVGRVNEQVRTTTTPPEPKKAPPASMLKAFQRLPLQSMTTTKKGGGQ